MLDDEAIAVPMPYLQSVSFDEKRWPGRCSLSAVEVETLHRTVMRVPLVQWLHAVGLEAVADDLFPALYERAMAEEELGWFNGEMLPLNLYVHDLGHEGLSRLNISDEDASRLLACNARQNEAFMQNCSACPVCVCFACICSSD